MNIGCKIKPSVRERSGEAGGNQNEHKDMPCEVAAVKATTVDAAFNYHGASLAKMLNVPIVGVPIIGTAMKNE